MTPAANAPAAPPPYVLGIVGGIGSGKSTAARVFCDLGVPVFDADTNAKAHLRDEPVIATLRERFGASVIGADGQVDRAALASVVFADRAKLKQLESILHPLVLADQHAFIAEARSGDADAVLIDAPLLLEAGFDAFCHKIVFVEADRATRLARVASSRGWSEADFDAREASQWPIERKKEHADHVLQNGDDDPSLESQIRSILATLGSDQNR